MRLSHIATLAGLLTGLVLITSCAAPPAAQSEKASPKATAAAQKPQITILYDAFGKDPAMTKDWGFSALMEVGGKRILFDTGNNSTSWRSCRCAIKEPDAVTRTVADICRLPQVFR